MEEFLTFNATWPWPWIGPYGTPSCITHRPLPTLHTKFNPNWRNFLWTDGRRDSEASFISFNSNNNNNHHHRVTHCVNGYIRHRWYNRAKTFLQTRQSNWSKTVGCQSDKCYSISKTTAKLTHDAGDSYKQQNSNSLYKHSQMHWLTEHI